MKAHVVSTSLTQIIHMVLETLGSKEQKQLTERQREPGLQPLMTVLTLVLCDSQKGLGSEAGVGCLLGRTSP